MWIPRQFNLPLGLALILLAGLAAPALAADLVVLAPASATPGARALAADFTKSTGIAVTVGGGARDKVIAALKTGPADVVLLPSNDIAELSNVNGMTPLGRITVGVAVKAGSPVPDVSTPEKFRKALLAAKGVAYADPSAGTSAGQAIDRMLAQPEFAGVKRVPIKGLAVMGLASGQASIALQLLPELAANKDVALAGPVPDAYGAGVDFSAGIAAVSNDSVKAQTFIAFLTDPKAAATWKANGLAVPGAH